MERLSPESDRVPQITGTGRSGSGAFTPQIKAISPPIVGNSSFTVSVSGAVGNSQAVLVVDSVDPGVGNSIPGAASFAHVTANTQNTGVGNGWASVSLQIPDISAVVGQTFFARWYVPDAGAANGFAVSQAAQFTVFGVASSASNASISGRVLTPDGRGLRNATVILTFSNGVSQRVTTNSFGLYQFNEIPSGGSYIVSVSSKRYRFAPQTFLLSGNLTLDLVGLE